MGTASQLLGGRNEFGELARNRHACSKRISVDGRHPGQTGWYAELAMIYKAPLKISCDTSSVVQECVHQEFFGGAG